MHNTATTAAASEAQPSAEQCWRMAWTRPTASAEPQQSSAVTVWPPWSGRPQPLPSTSTINHYHQPLPGQPVDGCGLPIAWTGCCLAAASGGRHLGSRHTNIIIIIVIDIIIICGEALQQRQHLRRRRVTQLQPHLWLMLAWQHSNSSSQRGTATWLHHRPGSRRPAVQLAQAERSATQLQGGGRQLTAPQQPRWRCTRSHPDLAEDEVGRRVGRGHGLAVLHCALAMAA